MEPYNSYPCIQVHHQYVSTNFSSFRSVGLLGIDHLYIDIWQHDEVKEDVSVDGASLVADLIDE